MPNQATAPENETPRKSAARGPCDAFARGLISYRPNLRAFACSLTWDTDLADDLVQETCERALLNRDKFDLKTNQRAWLFTILKNAFRSRKRRERRETELTDAIESRLKAPPDGQENALFLSEVTDAVRELPPAQMRAILLVAARGYSIDEAARHENCAPGTIKSRVSRGRTALAGMTF